MSISNCVIRKIYCGNGSKPADTATVKYSRIGTPYECMKRGFGVADWQHRKKNLPKTSLQQIPYIGPIYEANFKKMKIATIPGLLNKMARITSTEKRKIIAKGCQRTNSSIDQRAFNSVILFLHSRKIKQLPTCKIVRE